MKAPPAPNNRGARLRRPFLRAAHGGPLRHPQNWGRGGLLCLVLLFAGAGCSSRFTQADPEAAQEGRDAGSPSAAVQPTLRVNLAGLPGVSEDQAARLGRAWEAASGTRAIFATSGTGAADVVIVSSSNIGDAVAARQIASLGGSVAGSDTAADAEEVPESARRALTVAGTPFALPLTARLRVLTYDPAQLRAAGLDDRPAPTLEALRAQWQAAARSGASPAAAATPAAATAQPKTVATSENSLADDVALVTAAFGGSLVEEDGTLAVTSKEAAQAVEFLKTLRAQNLLPSAPDTGTPSAISGPFGLAYLDGDGGSASFSGLPPALAAYDAQKRPFVVTGEVFGVAISSTALDKALAGRFVRFLTDPVVARGLLGARSLTAGAGAPGDGGGALARLARQMTVPGGALARAKNRGILDRYVRAALEGTLPVSEALAKAAAEIEGQPPPAPAPDPAPSTSKPAPTAEPAEAAAPDSDNATPARAPSVPPNTTP